MEIEFFLTEDKVRAIHKLFNESQDPGFVILREDKPDAAGCVVISIYFKNSIILWGFVPSVEELIPFGERADSFIKLIKNDPDFPHKKDDIYDGLQ